MDDVTAREDAMVWALANTGTKVHAFVASSDLPNHKRALCRRTITRAVDSVFRDQGYFRRFYLPLCTRCEALFVAMEDRVQASMEPATEGHDLGYVAPVIAPEQPRVPASKVTYTPGRFNVYEGLEAEHAEALEINAQNDAVDAVDAWVDAQFRREAAEKGVEPGARFVSSGGGPLSLGAFGRYVQVDEVVRDRVYYNVHNEDGSVFRAGSTLLVSRFLELFEAVPSDPEAITALSEERMRTWWKESGALDEVHAEALEMNARREDAARVELKTRDFPTNYGRGPEDSDPLPTRADVTEALAVLRKTLGGAHRRGPLAKAFQSLDRAGVFADVDQDREPTRTLWRYEASRISHLDHRFMGKVFGHVYAVDAEDARQEVRRVDRAGGGDQVGYLGDFKLSPVRED